MRSEKLWDKLAGNWDKPGVSLGENDIKLIEKTKQYLNANSTFLDYGCATGSICFEIARAAGNVYGVDISSKMIDIAKRKASENGTGNINFIYGSIFNEGLKKESFDVITAFSILHLVEDIPQVMSRINHLLKPGGVFISATPCLGAKKIIGLIIAGPVFVLSKLGALPKVNFFSVSALKNTITTANFQIIDDTVLNDRTTREIYIAARKR
jgi:2-polyprenyl-3-methyl-5-hydroxy-6-metoxy-1,4-benzoquinol methylase